MGSFTHSELAQINSLSVCPKLVWTRCPVCASSDGGGICLQGSTACCRHRGKGTFKIQKASSTGTYYLYERVGSEYHPHHQVILRRFLETKYSAAQVQEYFCSRSIHHLNGNGLDNRLENLLPLLSMAHFAGAHHLKSLTAGALWELDRVIATWMIKYNLLCGSWHPDTLPCLEKLHEP